MSYTGRLQILQTFNELEDDEVYKCLLFEFHQEPLHLLQTALFARLEEQVYRVLFSYDIFDELENI